MGFDIVALIGVFIPIVAILVTGGVILLRPITTRLGSLLEVMAQQKRGALPGEASDLREHIDNLERRLSALEARQNFDDALLSSGEQQRKVPSEGGKGNA